MDKGLQKTITITVATALLTFITSVLLNHFQHLDQLNQDKIKFEHESKQDRLKFEYDIVSNVLKNETDQNDIWKKLRLYSKLGLLTTISQDSLGQITNEYTDEPTLVSIQTESSVACKSVLNSENSPSKNRYRIAKDFEADGYSHLLIGDLNNAAKSFKQSDSAFPGYHNSYEIYSLLKTKKYTLNGYYYLILKRYSWGISKDIVDSIKMKLRKKR